MKEIVGLSKKDVVTMSDRELVEFGLKVGCYNYGSRKEAEDRIYKAHFMAEKERKVGFWEIHGNPEYFEIDEDEGVAEGGSDGYGVVFTTVRCYNFCQSCGYVKIEDNDPDTEYLDAHCKCGDNITYDIYPVEEYEQMVKNRQANDQFDAWYMDADYERDHKNLVNKLIADMRGE